MPKTTKEIIDVYKRYSGMTSGLVTQQYIDAYYEINDNSWFSQEELNNAQDIEKLWYKDKLLQLQEELKDEFGSYTKHKYDSYDEIIDAVFAKYLKGD